MPEGKLPSAEERLARGKTMRAAKEIARQIDDAAMRNTGIHLHNVPCPLSVVVEALLELRIARRARLDEIEEYGEDALVHIVTGRVFEVVDG
jgi:hypothetical protein